MSTASLRSIGRRLAEKLASQTCTPYVRGIRTCHLTRCRSRSLSLMKGMKGMKDTSEHPAGRTNCILFLVYRLLFTVYGVHQRRETTTTTTTLRSTAGTLPSVNEAKVSWHEAMQGETGFMLAQGATMPSRYTKENRAPPVQCVSTCKSSQCPGRTDFEYSVLTLVLHPVGNFIHTSYLQPWL